MNLEFHLIGQNLELKERGVVVPEELGVLEKYFKDRPINCVFQLERRQIGTIEGKPQYSGYTIKIYSDRCNSN
jgi:hypothetical protein